MYLSSHRNHFASIHLQDLYFKLLLSAHYGEVFPIHLRESTRLDGWKFRIFCEPNAFAAFTLLVSSSRGGK